MSSFLNMQDLRKLAFHISFLSELSEYITTGKMRASTKKQDNTEQRRGPIEKSKAVKSR